MGKIKKLAWALSRRKPMDMSDEAPTDLDRCLNTLDLTAMGVGATLGLGLYVLSGEVAAMKAGPGVVLSFMIAAIASTFSALCYAEFAAKVPKSGSAYAYSYITVGEFVAFVIGWNLTLEHVIGTASLARGYSGYLGSLLNVPKANHSLAHPWMPDSMNGYLSEFDWLAFGLTMLVTALLLLGVQVSSKFQITFATINLSVAAFIFVCGLFKADFHNWQLTKAEIPKTAGEGGFLPFGFTGVIAGASTCFFAFVGFDGIAATAEEVKNPRKAIPNSILWTSGIIFITYSCMATIQTLIWPYWDQKQDAPLPYIFDQLHMDFAKWTVLVGVLAGLSTSFVGSFLPLPRILYAMARDGVIYRILSVVSKGFKVPYIATIIGGVLIAFLASLLDIEQLADMLSIGTLAAYSLVSISVLLLRYECKRPSSSENPLPITYQDINSSSNNNNNNNNSTSNNGLSLKSKNLALATKQDSMELKENLAGHGKSVTNGNSLGCNLTEADENSASGSSNDQLSVNSANTDCSSGTSCRSLMALFVEGTRGLNNSVRRPDEQTTHVSRVVVLILVVITTLLDFALVAYGPILYRLEPVPVIACGGLLAATLFFGYLLNRLPVAEPSTNSFEVPMVPFIPVFSVLINSYLMLNLSIMTWIRFAVWMVIGFFIYFTYGIFNSTGYKDSRCD